MAAIYRQSKGRFRFHNENPKNSLSSNDCVIRAIAKGTNQSWEDVYKDLSEVGLKVKDVLNSKKVFQKYLKNKGYEMQKQVRKSDNTKLTAEEFAEEFDKGNYIINLAGHLSVVIDGYIYDTWNCSHKTVGNYWKVK